MSILGSGYTSTTDGQTLQNTNLVTGVPLPTPPGFNEEWTLAEYRNEVERYIKQLHDYLRRLSQSIGQTIIQGDGGGGGITPANVVTDWRLDPTTKHFQVKKGGNWVDVDNSSVQPAEVDQVQLDTNYSTTTHVLSKDVFSNVLILAVSGSVDSNVNVNTATNCTP